VIEVDGGYHNYPQQMKLDAERTKALEALGYIEIRFTNEEILCDTDRVLKVISNFCAALPSKSHPSGGDLEGAYDSNYWLCTITLDPSVKIKGQENAYKTIVKGAVGGAAGVIHVADSATTDCQPNDNVEAMRVALDQAQIEARPVWKPMHKQPVYCRTIDNGELTIENLPCGAVCQTSATSVAYVNGVSEAVFKVGMCLPAGPYVSDNDVRYIVDTIKASIL
jgi:hypothetical protein